MRLKIEDRVRTTKMAGTQDFNPEARKYAKWNQTGKVVDMSGSHGLCYKIQHDDAECSQCWYNPEEIEPVDKKVTIVLDSPEHAHQVGEALFLVLDKLGSPEGKPIDLIHDLILRISEAVS